MSANEINTDNSAETPAPAVQKPAATDTPAAPQQVSRLYARYRRDKTSTPTPTASTLSSEPVTSADNLPVRATAPAHLIGDSERGNEDRYERPERRERSDRRDRDRDRGRGRRDQGDRRDRSDHWDRNERRSEPAIPTEAADSGDETPQSPSDERPETAETAASASSATERSHRGPRFEESGEQAADRSHLIQEFKPSRHVDSTSRQSRENESKGKKGSLMGWIKSVFTGGDTATETPAARPTRSRGNDNRGPRQHSGEGTRDGRPRRRRRGRRSGSGGGQNRGRRDGGGRGDGGGRPSHNG